MTVLSSSPPWRLTGTLINRADVETEDEKTKKDINYPGINLLGVDLDNKYLSTDILYL